MITITMTEVVISTGSAPNGTKALVLDDKPSGIRVMVPLDEKSARAVAAALTSGLVVASKIPGDGA